MASSAPTAFRAFITTLHDQATTALSNRRLWSELINPSAFSKPDSLSDATSRLQENYTYFRINYLAIITLTLAISLITHPLSLFTLTALFSSWCFLYLFKPSDSPLVLFNLEFSDKETLGLLVVTSVFVICFNGVGSVLMLALIVGVAIVCAHGAFQMPKDLSKPPDSPLVQFISEFSGTNLSITVKFPDDQNLSYDFLSPQLKQCIAYCSLFPKNYKFSKVELVHLWIAQGYVKTEDKGRQYFQELIRNNFFEEVMEDILGANVSCKINNSVYQQKTVDKNVVVDNGTSCCTDRVMHAGVCLLSGGRYSSSWEFHQLNVHTAKNLRSLIIRREHPFGFGLEASLFEKIIRACQFLRTLDLEWMKIKVIPNSLGSLRELRSLNISGNLIKCLPKSITRLIKLQTLNLDHCKCLSEWPADFTKLGNLRHLQILGCPFTDMPLKFGKMKSLCKLNRFIVGKNTGVDTVFVLRGELSIEFRRWRKNAVLEAKRAHLLSCRNLVRLTLDFGFKEEPKTPTSRNVELVLEGLKLPSSLRSLHVIRYSGEEMLPRLVDVLPNIVQLRIEDCVKCRALPPIRRLHQLKSLCLSGLQSLVYIDDNLNKWGDDQVGTSYSAAVYFPVLETLQLWGLPKLKCWTRMENIQLGQPRLFPRLLQLSIWGCQELMSLPQVPKLKSLKTDEINEKLLKALLTSYQDSASSSSASSRPTLKSLETSFFVGLRNLTIESPRFIKSLSALENLKIEKCEDLGDTNGMSLVWQGLKNISSLVLTQVLKLKSIPTEITLLSTLQCLEISSLPNLIDLPNDIGNLCHLQKIRISDCPKLASFPQSVRRLSNLRCLEIQNCRLLQRRCQQPNGEDWPLIQQIPNLIINLTPTLQYDLPDVNVVSFVHICNLPDSFSSL